MSLGSALQIGRSGILASQTALQVVGNNLANVSTPGYHRQTTTLTPLAPDPLGQGLFVGRGVKVGQITRHISEALEGRIRSGISNQAYSLVQQDTLSQVEALENEFTDVDLSTNLTEFFDAFSELANTPGDHAKRTLVVEQGRKLASFIQDLRSNVNDLKTQVDESLSAAVQSANDTLSQLATVNLQVATTEQSAGDANTLRDKRDALLADLSQFVDISTVEQADGKVDVFVGSIPLILNGSNRGLQLQKTPAGSDFDFSLVLKADGSPLPVSSGQIKGLLDARQNHVSGTITELDRFASDLIFQVNRIHSQGQADSGFTSLVGTTRFQTPDATLNTDEALSSFPVTHGSFQVHLTQTSTGQRVTRTINVDLDGIDAGNDSTLNSVVAAMNNVENLTATVTAGGQLSLQTSGSDYEVSFSDDTSGFLAGAGLNTFFTGSTAADIDVNSILQSDVGKIAAGQGHVPGDNRNALALAGLRSQSLSDLGGISLTERWNQHVEGVASQLGQAKSAFKADEVVQASLDAQQQAISGVNADEEAINLLAFQRAFQGSARFISVVDEMMQTLLQLI